MSSIPGGFAWGATVILNNSIYILGCNSSYNYIIRKYNGSTWASLGDLPYKFDNNCATVYNNEIHLMGGTVNGTATNHYKYNGSTWTSVSTLPYNFCHGMILVIDNEIHIFGGPGYNANKHYKYDGSKWIKLANIVIGYYCGAYTILNNKLHILSIDGLNHVVNTPLYMTE